MIITLCQPLLDYRITDCDDLIQLFRLNNDDYMRIPDENTLAMFNSKPRVMTSLGGSSLNTVLKINECSNIDVKFFGAIGYDQDNEDLNGLVGEHSVGFYFDEIPSHKTGHCFIILKKSKRILCTWQGASEHMRPSFIEQNRDVIGQAQIAYLSVFIVSFDHNTVELFLKCLRKDIVLVINLGSEKLYRDDTMGFIDTLLKDAKVIIGNKSETNALITKKFGPSVSMEEGINQIAQNETVFICTDGPQNVKYAYKGEIYEVKVPTSKQVFNDTCGAGDSFAAGVLVGLHEKQAIRECVELGIKYASETLEKNEQNLNERTADERKSKNTIGIN